MLFAAGIGLSPIKTSLLYVLVFVLCYSTPSPTNAYSTGAPTIKCRSLTPGHPATTQPLPGPYDVLLSKESYGPFEAVEVKLNAPKQLPFSGFIIQAVDANNIEKYVGTFEPASNTKYVCGQHGLTHISGTLKDTMTFTWRAPITVQSDVVFRATIVRDYFTYYVDIRSAVLKRYVRLPASSIFSASSLFPSSEATISTLFSMSYATSTLGLTTGFSKMTSMDATTTDSPYLSASVVSSPLFFSTVSHENVLTKYFTTQFPVSSNPSSMSQIALSTVSASATPTQSNTKSFDSAHVNVFASFNDIAFTTSSTPQIVSTRDFTTQFRVSSNTSSMQRNSLSTLSASAKRNQSSTRRFDSEQLSIVTSSNDIALTTSSTRHIVSIRDVTPQFPVSSNASTIQRSSLSTAPASTAHTQSSILASTNEIIFTATSTPQLIITSMRDFKTVISGLILSPDIISMTSTTHALRTSFELSSTSSTLYQVTPVFTTLDSSTNSVVNSKQASDQLSTRSYGTKCASFYLPLALVLCWISTTVMGAVIK